jgi:hypothetical protein
MSSFKLINSHNELTSVHDLCAKDQAPSMAPVLTALCAKEQAMASTSSLDVAVRPTPAELVNVSVELTPVETLWAKESVQDDEEAAQPSTSVTDLQGPPSECTQEEKIRDLKTLVQQYARDRGSCDDTRISYLEFVESEAEADLTLARMIAG